MVNCHYSKKNSFILGEWGRVEKEKINPKGKRNGSRKKGSTFFFPPKKGKTMNGKFVPPSTHGFEVAPW